MKRILTIVCTVLCLLAYVAPTWAQASTEGKDFWVGLTLTVTPPDKGKTDWQGSDASYYTVAKPYIAVSAKKKGTVITLTNPASPAWSLSYTTTSDNEWHEFTTIPISQWYPDALRHISQVDDYADQTNNFGIHVSSTEEVSVYSVLRAKYGMDASNILPLNTLQSEYIVQDYFTRVNDLPSNSSVVTMTTILATEDNTTIEITPSANTFNNTFTAGVTGTITLNRGQTYYLMSSHEGRLNGTSIKARNNKKIAVFNGVPCTQLPAGVSARDCLYEQAMPLDYWGTQFVVTRSLDKDGQYFGITAMEDGTTISINGQPVSNLYIDGEYIGSSLQRGQTYYIELDDANDPANQNASKILHPLHASQRYLSDALYIETSCPVAVYGYDTGNSYKGKSSTVSGDGDPSSVWISPLQQRINHITFGSCGTDKTKMHYLNIVCKTSSAANTNLSSNMRANIPTTFIPVPGNSQYSYARILMANDNSIAGENVFQLSNPDGIVAHVYGIGQDESYAYSVGSAAVKRGVKVEGYTYIDGYLDTITKYCVNEPVTFDAQVGTDVVDKVDWDFGDGVTEDNGTPQFSHTYNVPGWYDVIARVYAHKDCPETTYPAEDVHFSFYVARPKTIHAKPGHVCLGEKEEMPANAYQENGRWYAVETTKYDCDSIVIRTVEYGRATSSKVDTIAEESFTFHGQTFTESSPKNQPYIITLPGANMGGCDSTIYLTLTIVTCLDMKVSNNAGEHHVCPGETFEVPFEILKGEIASARLICQKLQIDTLLKDYDVDSIFRLPTKEMLPGEYDAEISVYDEFCDTTLHYPLTLQVYYPNTIFAYKYGSILAVFMPEHNGGYNFTGYQWYRDGVAIPGANSSVYNSREDKTSPQDQLPYGAYSVALTLAGGPALPSCELVIDANTLPYPNTEYQTNAPERAPEAEKIMIGDRLCIRVGTIIYDMYGNVIR